MNRLGQINKRVGKMGANPPSMSWDRYWRTHLFNEEDLALKFDSRTGNILSNSKSAETASILVEEFKGDGTRIINGDKTRSVEHLFDGNDHTVYYRIKQPADITTATIPIMWLGCNSTTIRGIYIGFQNERIRCYMSDGTSITNQYIMYLLNAQLKPLDYADIVIQINGTTKQVTFGIYNPSGTLICNDSGGIPTAIKTFNLAAYTFNTNDNGAAYAFYNNQSIVTNFKKFTGIVSLANCKDNSYSTGLVLHYPSIVGMMNAVEDANHLTPNGTITSTHITYINFNSYALDYGWDNYQQGLINVDNTQWNRYCCRTASGVQIKPDVTIVGNSWNSFRVVGERAGGTLYNLFPGKIRFTNDFFDRSNATIWNDACRAASDYDAANTKDFATVSLNQRTLQSWLNDGYRGRLIMHFEGNSIERLDRQWCKGIYLYTTDNKGENLAKIHQYTGDKIAWVLNGTQRTLDTEGYTKLGTLKTTKPMVSVVIDDGYLDAYTGWRPFFATNNISPLSGLHSDQVGEVIDGNDSMTWEQIQTLYSEGWIFGNHNTIDSVTDYSNGAMQATLESLLTEGKADIEARGIVCNWYVGNRHSSNNAAIEYFTHKLGYKGHFTWNVYGEGGVVGANPLALNLYRIRRINTDVNPPAGWDLDKADATTELSNICDEIDIIKAENRWLVFMLHNPSANLYTHLQTVFDYINTIEGVYKVSPDEAFANCKYL